MTTRYPTTRPRLASTLLAFTLAMASVPASAAFVIDTFGETAHYARALFGALPAPSTAATATGEAVGGFRTLAVHHSAGPGATSIAVQGPQGGKLTHSQDFLSTGIASVTWDGGGSGLGGVDLSASGSLTHFEVGIVGLDVGQVDLSLTVRDTGGDSDSVSLSGLGVGPQRFAFSLFSASVDMSAVDVIALTIGALPSSDLALDHILAVAGANALPDVSAVPIPPSLALMATALLVGVRLRRS